MVISRGYLAKSGVKKSSVWGTAVDCNVAGAGLNILNESLVVNPNLLEDETLTGTADQGVGVTSSTTVTGGIETNLQYSNPVLMTLIAMCMGRADTPLAPLGSSYAKAPYAYYMSMRLGDNVEGYFATMCFDKMQDSSTIHEFDSVKVNGMTISGAAGEYVKIAFDLIGRSQATSGTTTTSLSAATTSSPIKYVRFEDLDFRLSTQDDTALDQADQFYPTSFTITLNNNLVGDLTSLNAPYIDEPIRDAARSIEGSVEIPKLTESNTETRFLAGTVMKMSIRARSTTQIPAAGGGPYYYGFEMYMPAVQLTEASRSITGFAKTGAPFSFVAKKATSAPDGMDGNGNLDTLTNDEARGSFTESLRIEVCSLIKTNPLA